MSKKKSKQTIGFRPTEWEEQALAAAENLTGENRSEILRRCVNHALPAVVDELQAKRDAAQRRFSEVIKQREQKDPPAQKKMN